MRYFDPQAQNITKIVPLKNNLNQKSSKALIYTKSNDYANSFIHRYNNDFINTDLIKSPLKAKLFDLKRKETGLKVEESKNMLMLYNLAYEITNFEISKYCKEYGDIEKLYMPMRSDRLNMGYAIVKFLDKKASKRMLENVRDFLKFLMVIGLGHELLRKRDQI